MLQHTPRPGPTPSPRRSPKGIAWRAGAAPRSYRQERGIAASPLRLRLFGELALVGLVVMAMTAAILVSVFRSPASLESPSPLSLVVTAATARERQGALLVPASSVVVRDGRSIVFRLQGPGDESRVRALQVVAGRCLEGWVEILGNLAAGDRVVAQGAGTLVDRDLVRVEPSTVLMDVQPVADMADGGRAIQPRR